MIAPTGRLQDRVSIAHITDLNLGTKDHPSQVIEKGILSIDIEVKEDRLTIIDEVELMLDPTVGIEDQSLLPLSWLEFLQVLRRERMEPTSPLLSSNFDHRSM